MHGVVFHGERELELMQFPDPSPDAHDVVIEMKASGMCGSDLHQYRRAKGGGQASGIPMRDGPVIAGHEPCGVVVAVGSAVGPNEARVGQRVMVHHYQGCTQCNHCRAGWQIRIKPAASQNFSDPNNPRKAMMAPLEKVTAVMPPNPISPCSGLAGCEPGHE